MTHSSHYQTPGVAETLDIQETDMPPRETVDRRIGHTEDIADIVQFLASDAAAFVTGETVTVKGVPRARNWTTSAMSSV